MPYRRTTFSKFVLEDLRRASDHHDPDLSALLNDLQRAFKLVGAAVARGALDHTDPHATETVPLHELVTRIMVSATEWGGRLAGIFAPTMDAPHQIPLEYPRGAYLLLFNPLSGRNTVDVNQPVGTIFGILRAPESAAAPDAGAYLQPGRALVCAGYVMFGPVAMLVVSLGAGVHGFTLDREAGAYTLTHPNMRIPDRACEFAIDVARQPHWEPPVRRFVDECTAGETGPRGTPFTMRWMDSLVSDIHRVLIRGGVVLHPRETPPDGKEGYCRLLTEANPLSFLIEQAGGATSTGREPILGLTPTDTHARVPFVFGTRAEVERIERYHREHDRGETSSFDSPLFRARTIFRSGS